MRSGDALRSSPQAGRGFGLLFVLFALAAIGIMLAGTGEVWHTVAQREKESELLFVGRQFRQALAAYHDASPGNIKEYPARLEELLEDRRSAVVRRHLRKIYRDPMTGASDWGLVLRGGRIVGVHSLAQAEALRRTFDARDSALAGATRYDQWVFVAEPSGSAQLPPASGKERP